MTERGISGKLIPYTILVLGVAILALPVWITVMASTNEGYAFLRAPMPVLPNKALPTGDRSGAVWFGLNEIEMARRLTLEGGTGDLPV